MPKLPYIINTPSRGEYVYIGQEDQSDYVEKYQAILAKEMQEGRDIVECVKHTNGWEGKVTHTNSVAMIEVSIDEDVDRFFYKKR